MSNKRVLDIIKWQAEQADDRFEGWSVEVVSLVVEILRLEQQHSINKTRIEGKILDRINTTAQLLYEKRNKSGNKE